MDEPRKGPGGFQYQTTNPGGRYALLRERVVHEEKLKKVKSVVDTRTPVVWKSFNKLKASLPNPNLQRFLDLTSDGSKKASSFSMPTGPGSPVLARKGSRSPSSPQHEIDRPSPSRSASTSSPPRPSTSGSRRSCASHRSKRAASADRSRPLRPASSSSARISVAHRNQEHDREVINDAGAPSISSLSSRAERHSLPPQQRQVYEEFVNMLVVLEKSKMMDLVEDALKDVHDRRLLHMYSKRLSEMNE